MTAPQVRFTFYPTTEEILHLHRRLLERFGGRGGVRDHGLLESALARPRTGYYQSLSEQAAAYLQSLACNHAFTDGNKRVAFSTAAIFLRLNGYRLRLDPDMAEQFIVDEVIGRHVELSGIAAWLEQSMRPL